MNTIPSPAQYISDYEQMGLGMFIHYGLYSQLGMGEWVYDRRRDSLPMAQYEKLAQTFAPGSLAPMVKLAKQSGCKYVCLTTRHHEGFSLYDTRGLSDFDSVHAPLCRRDLVKEFVDLCRQEDLVPFFYHTTLDWHHDAYETDFSAYLDYLCESVKLLCTNYGEIGGFWFDGNWDKPDADWQEDRLYGMIHHYQPRAMIINNTGLQRQGELGHPEIDAVTFERGTPTPMDRRGHPKYVAGEMCQTLCDHWGIANDINFKSPKQLIEDICLCRKVGANMLLNIGPAPDGSVPAMQQGIMECIGKWMAYFGEAVRNGRPWLTFENTPNFVLKDAFDENTVYLFCFDVPRVGNKNVALMTAEKDRKDIILPHFPRQVESVCWMDSGEELTFTQTEDALTLGFPCYYYGTSLCVGVAKLKLR